MFKLPFTTFLSLFKKPKGFLEDGIDRCSSWIGGSLMLIFCTIATVGLTFGNHFECFFPANYNQDWQKFMRDFCYVQPHFYADLSSKVRLPQIYYFPWLPYFFFAHAIGFYLPKFLWKIFANTFQKIDLEFILNEANLISKSDNCKDDVKSEKIATLAEYMKKALGFSDNGFAPRYFSLSSSAFLFLVKKFLYVGVACTQFYAIGFYVGHGNFYWGFEVLSHTLFKNVYFPSKFFPLFTFCQAPIAEDRIFIEKTVSCVLGMNVIYEKLYVLTYFMLLGIIAASFLSLIYYTLLFLNPLRTKLIEDLLRLKKAKVPEEHVGTFTLDFLGVDGFLAILLIKQNFGDDIAHDILKELWNHKSTFSLSFRKEAYPKPKGSVAAVPNRYAPIPLLSCESCDC